MLSKNKISEIRKLHQKKFREEQGCFLVEGTKSVIELLQSEITTEEVFATAEWITQFGIQIKNHIPCTEVSIKEMERISCFDTPQEVLAIAKRPSYLQAQIDSKKTLLVLDDIRNPGNLGTIIRTADWFGIDQILCSEDSVELTNPKTIQSTMGSFSRVKVFYGDIPSYLKGQKRAVYGMFMDGENIGNVDFKSDDILIIGNESHGISASLQPFITQKITIPSSDSKAESLNASIATAILLYQYGGQMKK